MAENKIGSASIEVGADIDPLKQDVSEARAEVETLGDAGEKAGFKINEGMEGAAGSINKATIGLTSMVGAIGAVTGAIGVLIAGVTAIIALFSAKRKKLDEMRDSYQSIQTVIDDFSTDNAIDQYEKLEKQVKKNIDALVEEGKVSEAGAQLLENELAFAIRVRKEEEKAEKTAEFKKRRMMEELKLAQERAKVIESLESLVRDQEIELLPDDEKVKAKIERQKGIIEDSIRDSGFAVSDELVEKALANIDRIAEKEAENVRRIEAEKTRLEQERIEKANQKQIEGAIKAADAFGERAQQALFGSTGAFTTQLDTILSELRSISSNQGKR